MNIKEKITKFLTQYDDACPMFMHDDFCIGELSSRYEDELILMDFDCESVKSYGGEGKGTDYWTVYKFYDESSEVLIKFSGYYQSHYGADFDNWKFVEPKQKTVTVWE